MGYSERAGEQPPHKQNVRSLSQNSRLWAMLHDISEQLEWPVDGRMQKLSDAEWKDVITAGLYKEQKVAQGINGGFVMLGRSTRKMTVREMKELMDFMDWFGAEKGVKFSAPEYYEEYAACAKARG